MRFRLPEGDDRRGDDGAEEEQFDAPLAEAAGEVVEVTANFFDRRLRLSPDVGVVLEALKEGLRPGRVRPDAGELAFGFGDAIPRLARMISIADTYDVMTSRDSYRSPVSSETRSPVCTPTASRA